MSAKPEPSEGLVHLALPKGRMEEGVLALLADAGIKVTFGRRGYRPSLSLRRLRDQDLEAPEHRRDAASRLARRRLRRRRLGPGARGRAGRAARHGSRSRAPGGGGHARVCRERARAKAVRHRFRVRAPDPRLAAAAWPAGHLRALVRRDRGVPAGGRRLHRRQHGDRRDAAGERSGRGRRADALLDPALCPSARSGRAGEARRASRP